MLLTLTLLEHQRSPMRSKAHWPVFMREQGNVDLNAALVAQPLSLAILLPLLSSPLLFSPLLSSSTVLILADTTHKGLNAGCILQQQGSLLFLLQLWSSTARLFACTAGCFCKTACNCISHLRKTDLAALLLRPLYPLLLLGRFIQGAHQHRASALRRRFFILLEAGRTTGSLFFLTILCVYVAGGRSCFLSFPVFVGLSIHPTAHHCTNR